MALNRSILMPVTSIYSTWNSSDKGAGVTLSNGNLTIAGTGFSDDGCRNIGGKSSGKWYVEITVDTASANPIIGVVNGSWDLAADLSSTANAWSYYGTDGTKRHSGNSAYGTTYTTGDKISCALDMDNGKVYWAKNGTWQNSGDPAAQTNPAFTGLTGPLYIACSTEGSASWQYTVNFGASAFTYTIPSGFSGWTQ